MIIYFYLFKFKTTKSDKSALKMRVFEHNSLLFWNKRPKNKKSHILQNGKCRDDNFIIAIPLCFTLASRQRASSGANTPTAINGRIYRKSLHRRMRNAFVMQNQKCKMQSENAERSHSGSSQKHHSNPFSPQLTE